MPDYRIELHPIARTFYEEINWSSEFGVAFWSEFRDKFPEYGFEMHDWNQILDDRYSIFIVMIGGVFSPRVAAVSDARTGANYLLGLVGGSTETELTDAAYELSCRAFSLDNPARMINSA